MHAGVRGLVVALGCLVLAGCGGGSPHLPTDANRGDCGAAIRFHGVVYRTDTRVNPHAPKGRTLGPGAVVGCDHRTAVDRVVVSEAKGVDVSVAIRVVSRHWRGIYVAEHLRPPQWPAVLRSR